MRLGEEIKVIGRRGLQTRGGGDVHGSVFYMKQIEPNGIAETRGGRATDETKRDVQQPGMGCNAGRGATWPQYYTGKWRSPGQKNIAPLPKTYGLCAQWEGKKKGVERHREQDCRLCKRAAKVGAEE